MSPLTGSPAFALILVAFLLNAAVPPLGAWLPDACWLLHGSHVPDRVHDQVRDLRLDPRLCRHHILVVGAAMAVYDVVCAVLENDARRLLAYIISQVGYMVCGVGIGTGWP